MSYRVIVPKAVQKQLDSESIKNLAMIKELI